MKAFLRVNNVEVKERLVKEGFILCKCSEYENSYGLIYTSGCYYEIHGTNDSECYDKDFGTDIDGFIEFCKQYKKENKN